MAQRRVRRGGTPIARRDPHLLHQRGDMVAAHLMAFLPEQVAQHPAAGKGILHVQLIKLTHHGHIGGSGGTTLVIDAASTQPKQPCLAAVSLVATNCELVDGFKQKNESNIARAWKADKSGREPTELLEDQITLCQATNINN